MAVAWRVLCVKSRSEKKALLSLSKLGCEVYVPLQKQKHTWQDRKKWVETVLFSGYVFIKCDSMKKNIAFNCVHVLKYAYIGSEEVILTGLEIETIRKLSGSTEKLEIGAKGFEVGEAVVLKSGYLKGLSGEVIKKESELYVRVEVIGLSCYIRTQINCLDSEELS